MNDSRELMGGRLAHETEQNGICGVLVMVDVAGRQKLLIRLGEDGSIHRLGNGSLEGAERDRYIGTTSRDAFEQVRSRITPQLLEWCGQVRSHPSPRGEKCELVVAFKTADGEELMMCWQYGSESRWPPQEVCDFVAAAIQATDPWYEEQKNGVRLRAKRAEYEWWHFFRIPSA
jgi:hypothetical protein